MCYFGGLKKGNHSRSGFNLVELLIVVAIIAVLASVTAGVVFKLLAAQKKSATENTVKLVQNAINRITTNVTSTSRQTYLKSNPYYYRAIANNLSNGRSTPLPPIPSLMGIIDPIRAGELVFVNTQIARTFPQSLNDFKPISPAGTQYIPNKPYVNIDFVPNPSNDQIVRQWINSNYNLNNDRYPLPSTIQEFESQLPGFYTVANQNVADPPVDADIQSASCLYFAIASHPEGLKKEELKSAISYLAVTKNGASYQIPYLADGSGKPIYFRLNFKETRAGNLDIPQGSVTLELIYNQE